MASLTCPHCGASHAIDESRLPATPVKATCHACHRGFDFDPASVEGAEAALDVDWGGRVRHEPAVVAAPVAPAAPSFRPDQERIAPPPVSTRRLVLQYGIGALLFLLLLGRCSVALNRPAFMGLGYEVMGHSLRGAGRIVIFLHGSGGSASNSRGWIDSFKEKLPPDTAFVVPDGPLGGMLGHTWFRNLAPTREEVVGDFNASREKVIALIDKVRASSSLQADRVFVTGFSQGAMVAVDVGLTYPGTLGGVMPISPCSFDWFSPGKDRPPVRFRFVHGKVDSICDPAASRAMSAALEAEGHTVELVSHEGSHQITAPVVDALDAFVR